MIQERDYVVEGGLIHSQIEMLQDRQAQLNLYRQRYRAYQQKMREHQRKIADLCYQQLNFAYYLYFYEQRQKELQRKRYEKPWQAHMRFFS